MESLAEWTEWSESCNKLSSMQQKCCLQMQVVFHCRFYAIIHYMQRTIFCDKHTHEQNKVYTVAIIGAHWLASKDVFQPFL